MSDSLQPHESQHARPPVPNVGLLLRRCSGKGLHLAMMGEPRGFSRVTAGFSNYVGEFRLPLVLAQGSPIFHSSCDGELMMDSEAWRTAIHGVAKNQTRLSD